MTKRVPLNSFTAEDGNPEDKRPRRGVGDLEYLDHSTTSPVGHHLQLPNELPSRSSTLDALSVPTPVLHTNGT